MFAPYTFARSQRTVANRFVVAAMTNMQSHPDGQLHPRELAWLRLRAEGGFGIVTTCAAHVRIDGQGWPGELGVFADHLLPGLTDLAGSITDAGSLGLVQIFHGGMRAPSALTGQTPWSATAFQIDRPGFEVPRPATESDILDTIEAFASAAARCEAAGFGGVELHGAHGYLLAQFLGRNTNTRSDRWGGASLKNRARLLLETLRAVRARTSERFIIGVRISPEITDIGIELDESLQVAAWLADAGADFVHASLWDAWGKTRAHPSDPVPLTTRFRAALPSACPLMVAGGVWTPRQAAEIQEQGADFIAMARVAIAHPDWPRRAQADPEYSPSRPPYTPQVLAEAGLSDVFIDYMRRWAGFVTDGKPAK
ncbi:MAG: NADH:flavin oxidoreductase [Myxococcota bacterium]|nr:NADH:flavin oxidoreductase [Myxococcota bacterium]